MGKGTFISLVALLIAVIGAIVAFAAYFKYRSFVFCDDDENEMDEDLSDLDYYATSVPDSGEEDSEDEQSAGGEAEKPQKTETVDEE